MKESLYTVPEGFFEDVESKTISRVGTIKKRRIALLCAMPVIIAVAYFGLIQFNQPAQDYSSLDNCDIFLEVYEY